MKKVEYWEVLGKQYKSEKEAREAEHRYIVSHAKYGVNSDVWLYDYINGRILKSYVKEMRLDYNDHIEYIVHEFGNPAYQDELFDSLDELIESFKAKIYYAD